jgi:hypothetical protein
LDVLVFLAQGRWFYEYGSGDHGQVASKISAAARISHKADRPKIVPSYW